jgi:hypothetical protein
MAASYKRPAHREQGSLLQDRRARNRQTDEELHAAVLRQIPGLHDAMVGGSDQPDDIEPKTEMRR